MEERDYGTSTTAFVATKYGFDRLGRVVTVTDDDNNVTTYGYDMLGHRVSVDDPSSGVSTSVFDAAGRVVTSSTENGTIFQSYDGLGRVIQRRVGNSTGELLAAFGYDAPGELGLADYVETWDGDGARVLRVDVDGYDDRNRALGSTYIVDEVAGVTDGTNPLAGSYTFGVGYDDADNVTSRTYPAVGGLPAETVVTGYNATGQAATLTGDYRYVKQSTFFDDGALATRQVNDIAGTAILQHATQRDPATLRVTSTATTVSTATVADLRYSYDTAGIPTQINDVAVGELSCFGYDTYQRLTSAYTTGATTCSGPSTGGPAPMNAIYTYDSVNRIINGPTGTDYQHDPAQPFAPAEITTPGGVDTYTYDDAGNRIAFADADGDDVTYTWDTYGRLATTTIAGADPTVNTYDQAGQRLLRQDPNGSVTLALGSTEITRTSAGAVSVVRSYDINGTAVGVRSETSISWLLGDHHGSVSGSVDHTTSVVSRAAYEPYGAIRAEDTGLIGDDRFLGQTRDASTGLHYLNNRHYDPTTGVFLSVDPLVAKTMQPYIYGGTNPVAMSDPSGLDPDTSAQVRARVEAKGGCTYSSGRACFVKRSAGWGWLHWARASKGYGRAVSTPARPPATPARPPATPARPPATPARPSPVTPGRAPTARNVQVLADRMIPVTAGACGTGGASLLGVGVDGSLCSLTTPTGNLSVLSVGLYGGAVVPSASGGGAILLSNGRTKSQFEGASACFGGSAGPGVVSATAMVCAGLDNNGDLTGVVTVIGGGEVGIIAPGPSAFMSVSHSWVWDNSPRPLTDIGRMNADPYGENHVGRHMSTHQPSFYNAGAPG